MQILVPQISIVSEFAISLAFDGVFIYIFLHPVFTFFYHLVFFFALVALRSFAYLRGRSTCYPQFVLSGRHRPSFQRQRRQPAGCFSPRRHFHSSRARGGNCLGKCEKAYKTP